MHTVTAMTIDQSGNVHGIYVDDLDLRDIGAALHCERASDVEWNDALQLWECSVPGHGIVARGTSRQGVIRAEVEFLADLIGA